MKTQKTFEKTLVFFQLCPVRTEYSVYFWIVFSKMILAKSFLITPCGKLVAIVSFSFRNRNYVICECRLKQGLVPKLLVTKLLVTKVLGDRTWLHFDKNREIFIYGSDWSNLDQFEALFEDRKYSGTANLKKMWLSPPSPQKKPSTNLRHGVTKRLILASKTRKNCSKTLKIF